MDFDNLNHEKNIICNKCEKKIEKNIHNYYDDFLEIKKRWNYHSSFDNEIHTFNLCEKCYKELINSFVIPINIED